jgi:hypothetical protein
MPVGLTKGLDTPESKKIPSVYCGEEARQQTQLFGMKQVAVVNGDPADRPHAVTLIIKKSKEVLTSSDFNYTALRSVTVIRIEIKRVRGGYAWQPTDSST